MPDLDRHLDATRADLLDQIQVPPMHEVLVRATRLRARRRRTIAGVGLACAIIVGTVSALPFIVGAGVATDDAATVSATSAPTWRGGGLSLLGLTAAVLDLPGDLRDVQFADPQRGYALAVDCQRESHTCTASIAVTGDGGRTWSTPARLQPPFQIGPGDQAPALVTLGGSGVLLAGAGYWYASDPTQPFTEITPGRATTTTISAGGRLWLRGPDAIAGCVGSPVEAWLSTGPGVRLARLTTQPAMQVCRVAPAPTAGGAWWVSGTAPSAAGPVPAVGVSRDLGRTWLVTRLPGSSPDAFAQVSTLGSDVYATVVSPANDRQHPGAMRVSSIYRSAAGGGFAPYVSSTVSVVGDLVPLLDGRLLACGPGWMVSPGAARPFTNAGGSMPWVARIVRSPGAWVAYDLFASGWVAVSTDGETWQKINLR